MDVMIRLCRDMRQAVIGRLQQAYQRGQVRLVRRIHALLFVIEGKAVDEVATMLDLGAQTVRDYVNAFLWRGVASLAYQKPAGRPPKLTKTHLLTGLQSHRIPVEVGQEGGNAPQVLCDL
jgi:hypothetical protein